MSWKVRHQGSPKSVEGLALQQVAQGLADGYWEPTDEVMGPKDTKWIAFENHPQFAEIAMDLEQKEPTPYDEESRLDMNAMIDVCLVLLIFFILTTTYTRLQKIIASPEVVEEVNPGDLKVISDAEIQESMIHVVADMQNGKPVIVVEKNAVQIDEDKPAENREKLIQLFKQYEGGAAKLTLLLEHADQVPHGIIVTIQDAGKSAGMPEVILAKKRGS